MNPTETETDVSRNDEVAKVRILHVIYSLSLRHGGPPEGLRQLAIAYQAADVHLEVASLDDPADEFLKELPFKVHAFGPVKSVFGYSSRLRKWLQANVGNYDAVVINGIWQYHCLAAGQAAKKAKVPYLVFIHGALDPWFKKRYPLKHLKKSAYWKPFQYPVLRDALAVLFTTQTESEQALLSFRLNRWNAIVIPYGTNKPSEDREQQIEAFFDICPAVKGKPYALFMARIHEKKGCDLLIDAFARISSRTGLHLVMAGPDQVGLKAKLIQRAEKLGISNRIHWPGLLQKQAKWGAFFASEVFVLPSHQENFGIAVAEALACATPVLISDKVNIWQDVVSDGAGFVAPDDAEGTYQLLSRWLESPSEQRKRMAENAISCFSKRYSMNGAAHTILNLIEGHRVSLGH